MGINYKGRCISCKHWQADRAEAVDLAERIPESMDLADGWAVQGGCGQQYLWMEVQIDTGPYSNGGTAEVEVNANFGCVYWEQFVEA